jgi:hypothetical protein
MPRTRDGRSHQSNASVSLEEQKRTALNASYVLQPGDKWPEEEEGEASATLSTAVVTLTATASTTAASSALASASSSSSPTAFTESHNEGLSPGAIAGIAIGKMIFKPSWFGGDS